MTTTEITKQENIIKSDAGSKSISSFMSCEKDAATTTITMRRDQETSATYL